MQFHIVLENVLYISKINKIKNVINVSAYVSVFDYVELPQLNRYE